MPTLKIDGREVTVEPGRTILQAAEVLGIEIPTFCYHPGLSIAANCRMCLVDITKDPARPQKLVPACHAQVADGMEVSTQNDRVQKTRKSVLEFILLNHPVDCPICDQAGECVLQDHYFKYSAQPSRLFHRKQHKPKAKVLGPDVILDAERCILCTRCVRFCDEVAKQPQLEVINRGEHSEITTFPGTQLDNPYAGNTVDICPVGALTSRDFRFRTRVWMLQATRSVCPECSRGCTTRVDTFENVPRRYKPLHNPKVNQYWMCDEGRGSYAQYLDGRMEGPTWTAPGGKRQVATVAQAVEQAAQKLGAVPRSEIAVVVSPWFTNEDAWLVSKLLAGPLAGAKVYLGGRADGTADNILRRADKNPNRTGVAAIFKAAGIAVKPLAEATFAGTQVALVFGDNHTVDAGFMTRLSAVPFRIVVGAFKNAFWDAATTFLPARIHWEKDGSFTNEDGVVQRIARAVQAAATAKSDGWYAMKIAQQLGLGLDYATPKAIFAALASEVPEFGGLRFDSLGDFGRRFGEIDPPEVVAPAAAAIQMEAP
jgi:NADH-quinone oxidoreductase subunit G